MFPPVQNINPPFRADHIGSLQRKSSPPSHPARQQCPLALLALREKFDAGTCTRAELRVEEEKAIKDVVALQRELGIKSVTDGEFTRHMFFDGFHCNLDGMEIVSNPPREIFKMYVPDIKAFFESHAAKAADTMICKGKLVRTKPMYRPEFAYLASLLPPDEVKFAKITVAAPEWFHLRHGEHAYDHSVYANDAEYFDDMAKAYREELADLYEAGCRNVQFDDPLLAYFAMLDGMKDVGVDPAPILDSYIKLYNDCIRDVPSDMIIGVHLCRGNFKNGMHFSEGGYEAISSKLFKELKANTYYLEYDTDRAGGFEPLADLPLPKTAVLGLVTSKFPALEKSEDLIHRVNEAASFLARGSGTTKEEALQRLCVSPQCGFASHAEGNDVSAADVRAKLTLIVDTAKAIWSDA